jgi:hypothetical protein
MIHSARHEEPQNVAVQVTLPGLHSKQFGGYRKLSTKSLIPLPNAQKYVRRLEAIIGTEVILFSVGPRREQTIVLKNLLTKGIRHHFPPLYLYFFLKKRLMALPPDFGSK